MRLVVHELVTLMVMLSVSAQAPAPAHAQTPAPTLARAPAGRPSAVTAFVNVTVVPMDRERTLPDQTVVVRDGRVVALGPASTVDIPVGAQRVDGTGRFLLPGLADMHVHLYGLGETDAIKLGEQDLLALLAHGVTTARNMAGSPEHLVLRARIARGELLGPRLYTAGPIVEGTSLSVDTVGSMIAAQRAAGYDFVKVYWGFGPSSDPTFDSLAAAARRAGMLLAGHAPTLDSMGVRRALRAGYRSLEHLHGYLGYILGLPEVTETGTGPVEEQLAQIKDKLEDSTRGLDEERLRRIVAETRRAGAWNDPTLALMADNEGLRWLYEASKPIIRALRDAGAGLLLGTDAFKISCDAPPHTLLGFTVYRELEAMVGAGLTRYEALLTGTRNVAEFFGTQDSTGTVAVGQRADLLLVDGNPLERFDGLVRPAGIMLSGRWWPRGELDTKLAAAGLSTDSLTCVASPAVPTP